VTEGPQTAVSVLYVEDERPATWDGRAGARAARRLKRRFTFLHHRRTSAQ